MDGAVRAVLSYVSSSKARYCCSMRCFCVARICEIDSTILPLSSAGGVCFHTKAIAFMRYSHSYVVGGHALVGRREKAGEALSALSTLAVW